MTEGKGRRPMAWIEEKAPALHRFLTEDRYDTLRTILSIALVLVIGASLLWGLTGQPLGSAPVVVIESGSMMHCGPGSGSQPRDCESMSRGRLGTIDPGDLIFVRVVRSADDVETFLQGGKQRFGMAGDVVIFDRGTGEPPIIHRAMFWIDLHGDGTFSIPDLGIERSSDLNHPALTGPEARERFGLDSGCRLFQGHGGNQALNTRISGFITKGDNRITNGCWDQGAGIHPFPVHPDQILGKARGELPWIGLLKLFVFDLFGPSNNYHNAPGDLKFYMWTSLVAIIVVPYGVEWTWKSLRQRQQEPPHRP